MRRKIGTLIPIERSILKAATRLCQQGVEEFYGFQIAKEIEVQRGSQRLVGLGTLYRALGRLQQQGFLCSRWENHPSAEQNRPRRRYYRLTNKASVGINGEKG